MTKYSVILHGAITPGREARDALGLALTSIAHFEAEEVSRLFSALPAVVRSGLSLDDAEALKFTLESLDGDVELLAQEDLDAPSAVEHNIQSPDDALFEEPSEADDFGDLSLSFDDEATPPSQPPAPSQPEPKAPVVDAAAPLFEFDLPDQEPAAPEPVKASHAKSSAPEVTFATAAANQLSSSPADNAKKLTTTIDIEASLGGIDAEFEETTDHGTDDETSEDSAQPTGSPENADDHGTTNAPLSADGLPPWGPPSPDWQPRSSGSIRRPTSKRNFLYFTGFVMIGAGVLMFLAPGNQPRVKVEISVDQLLKEQKRVREVSEQRALRNGTAARFDEFWEYSSKIGTTTIRFKLGRSPNGFEVAEVLAFSDPIKATREVVISGNKPAPWLRRFEVLKTVSANEAPQNTNPDDIRVDVASRIYVVQDERPHGFIGKFSVIAKLDPVTNELRGEWRLTNVELPDEFADTAVVREAGGGYEVIMKGSFSASKLAHPDPSPQPGPSPDGTQAFVPQSS